MLLETYTNWLKTPCPEAFLLKDNTLMYIACNDEGRGRYQRVLTEISSDVLDENNYKYTDALYDILRIDYGIDANTITIDSSGMIEPSEEAFIENGIEELIPFLIESEYAGNNKVLLIEVKIDLE